MTTRQEVQAPARLGRSEALDGLRAVAVLAVMARHAQVPFLPGGGAGVFVFFTLSGFLITTLLLQEGLSTGRVRLARFAGRRLRRLAPALLVLVAVLVTAGAAVPDVVPVTEPGQWLPAVLYVGNWARVQGVTLGALDHTWSLAVEEQFYLVWPFLVLLVLRARRERVVVGVLVVALAGAALSLAARVVLVDGGDGVDRVYNGTDTEADLLLLGAAAAALVQQALRRGRRPDLEALTARLVPAAVLVLVAVLLLQPLPERPAGTVAFFTVGLTVVGLAAGVLVVDVVLRPAGRPARLLATRPLPWLGQRSYALYLWHYPVFVVMTYTLDPGPAVLLLVGGPLAVALASLSHVLVERPLHRAGSV